MMRYVIIGAGIAGLSAAKAVRQHDPNGEITVFTNEIHPLGLYARKDMVRRLSAGRYEADSLLIEGETALACQGIQLEYMAIERIYPKQNQIFKDHGIRKSYDRLLIAAGATPRLVNAPGLHYLGVHQVRQYEDISWIEAWMDALRQVGAVVIGGGLLGLELAYALTQRGVAVTLVVREAHVGSALLPERAGKLVEQRLERSGIRVILERTLKAYLSSDERVLDAVELDDGQIIPARMALSAVGVHPNTAFLETSGIMIDQENGAVVVDSLMQTNLPHVYAAGNCAAVSGIISRSWQQAEEQGRTAGLNMVGHQTFYQPTYEGHLNSVLYDLPFSTFAGVGARSSGDNLQTWTWVEEPDHFAQVTIDEGRITSAVLLGNAAAKTQELLARFSNRTPTTPADLEYLLRGIHAAVR